MSASVVEAPLKSALKRHVECNSEHPVPGTAWPSLPRIKTMPASPPLETVAVTSEPSCLTNGMHVPNVDQLVDKAREGDALPRAPGREVRAGDESHLQV